MIPNDALLSSQIRVLFSYLSSEKLPPAEDAKNTETHSQTPCRVRDFGTLNHIWNVPIRSLSVGAQGTSWRRRRREMGQGGGHQDEDPLQQQGHSSHDNNNQIITK